MAVVHLGRLLGQAGFSRTVAIKRLHPQFAADPDFVAMFLDEARLAVRVQHPNVVSPLDVLVTDAELLVVMEYISGETLSALLKSTPRDAPVAPAIAASVVSELLYGLHAAHEARAEDGALLEIVHRDVSPHNVIVGVDGVARVLDFGVAKAAMRSHVTKEGEIKGKISYMAPEQLRAQPVDRRADVFAAGIVLWETLTGRRLFRGDDLGQTVEKVLHSEIPAPSSLRPGLTPELDAVVRRALERDVADRFATARDFAVALEAASPIASAGEVADWVRARGGNKLAERIERVAAIESHSSRVRVTGRSQLDTPLGLRPLALSDLAAAYEDLPDRASGTVLARDEAPTVRPGSGVQSGLELSSSALRAERRRKWLVAGASVLAACVALALLAFGGNPSPETPQLRATAAPPSAAPPVEVVEQPARPAPARAAIPAAVAPPAEVPEASAPTSASAPPSKPKTAPSTARVAPVAATGSAARKRPVSGRSAAHCNPPYVVDAQGIRRLRPECL
jgi:hypothetical protein